MSKTYRLVATAMLAALAFVLQAMNNVVGLPTGFGMTVDLVAVPALLALFIFGVESSVEVLALAAVFITLFSPTGPIGAAMKFAATMPTILVCAGYLVAARRSRGLPALFIVAAAAIAVSVALFALGAFAYSYLKEANLLLFGIMPIAMMAIAAYLALLYFGKAVGHAHKAFSDWRAVAALALVAIAVRGAAMVAANFYFAGPLYFKISPEEFVSMINSTDILFFGKGAAWYAVIFAFNALQAAAEVGVAWLIAYRLGFAEKYSKAD